LSPFVCLWYAHTLTHTYPQQMSAPNLQNKDNTHNPPPITIIAHHHHHPPKPKQKQKKKKNKSPTQVIRLLIERGCDLDRMDDGQRTPLIYAAAAHNVAVMR
jgi:hypothetical protein